MSDWPVIVASGARMSLDPFDTSRVCRRGDGLLSDDLRDTGNTSSFNGDGGLCTGLFVVWYELKMVCRGGLAEKAPLISFDTGGLAD